MKRFNILSWATAVLLVVVLAPTTMAAGFPDLGEGNLAVLDNGREYIRWQMNTEYERVHLTLSTPCGVIERTYKAGEDPFFEVAELEPDNPTGSYNWQLRIEPYVDPDVREALNEARAKNDNEAVRALRRKGLLPKGPFIQSGFFEVDREGGIVDFSQVEKEGLRVQLDSGDEGTEAGNPLGLVTGESIGLATAEQVISGDLVVYNSICVGFDCPTNPTFGADTIRLQENNLRIHADDTSTAASFPNQDWRLEFNSNLNGGGEYFRVIDASANRNIMTIEANAPSHSLYVESSGELGVGTANPVLEVHAVSGDSPGLRLEQDVSSGFAAQVWDVVGNETSFFVRDATNGSTLPFRIRPGASSNALVIDTDSDVGIGLLSPGYKLHVQDGGATTQTLLNLEASNATAQTVRLRLANSGQEWFNGVTSIGNLTLNAGGAAGTEFFITPSGDVTILGSITTGGPTCGGGCDRVFAPDYELPSIEEHAAEMWAKRHLPEVGPTEPHAPFNVSEKTGGILNELEKAHIYIEQLHNGLKTKDQRISDLERRLSALEEGLDTRVED